MLTWKDFQGARSTRYDANVYGVINFRITAVHVVDGQYKPEFQVSNFMDPSQSWSEWDAETEYLLKHEQLHFDIAEIYARRLYEALSTKIYTKRYRFETLKVGSDLYAQMRAAERQYDEETRHSLDTAKQLQWNALVEAQLKRLAKYPAWILTAPQKKGISVAKL